LKSGAAALKIAPQFNQWQSLYAQEDIALKKIVKSAFTEEIQDADKERDKLFRALAGTCKAALNHFDADVRAAAKRLKIVFDTYGDVAKKAFNEETSALYNLLADLKSSVYAGDVATVGLTPWLTPLEESNNAVRNLAAARGDESAARTDLVLQEVRTQIDELYNTIIEILNARTILDPNALLTDFIHRWNVDVQKYEDAVDNRYGKSAAAKSRADDANAEALAAAEAALANAEAAFANAQAAVANAAAAAAADPGNDTLQSALNNALEALVNADANMKIAADEVKQKVKYTGKRKK